MSKDTNEKFPPSKGKPSGSLKEENELPEDLENAHVLHQNRHSHKNEEKNTGKSTAGNSNTSNGGEITGKITREIIQELGSFRAALTISIYMPMHREEMKTDAKADGIRFKNMMKAVHGELKKHELNEDMVQLLLAPAEELIGEEDFWTNASEGIALFIAEDSFRYLKLNEAPEEFFTVNPAFYVTPLIPYMLGNKHFFLLSLSMKKAALFRGDAYTLVHVDTPEMPDGMDDVVHFEEKNGGSLMHSGTTGSAGENYQGISSQPDKKTHISVYFNEVDRTLRQGVLHNEHAPLLLAGVEYLIPIYKSVAEYQPILEDALIGNHDHDNLAKLSEEAREEMTPYFREDVLKAIEEYRNKIGSSFVSSATEEVVKAAFEGRIAKLFVAKNVHVWGTFSETEFAAEIHAERQEGDECLINKAAIATLQAGGEVFVLGKGKLPADGVMAALYRYGVDNK